MMPRGYEWLIIGFVVVLLFGTSKLPGLGKGLGEGIRSFKKAFAGEDEKPAATPPSAPTNDQAPKA